MGGEVCASPLSARRSSGGELRSLPELGEYRPECDRRSRRIASRSELSASSLLAWRTPFKILDCIIEIAAQIVELPEPDAGLASSRSARVGGLRAVAGAAAVEFSRSSMAAIARFAAAVAIADLLKRLGGLLTGRKALADGAVEIADLRIDARDQGLDRHHRLVVRDHGAELFDRLPQTADAICCRGHAVKALDLVLRAADFARGFDHVGGPDLHVHRQLQRRHADVDQAVQDALDLVEADQRDEGRADGEGGDQAEGDQQLAADAMMPGPAGPSSLAA